MWQHFKSESVSPNHTVFCYLQIKKKKKFYQTDKCFFQKSSITKNFKYHMNISEILLIVIIINDYEICQLLKQHHILLISLFTIKYLMQQVFSQKSSIQKWTLKLRNIYKKCDLLREEINCRFASVFHQHFSSSFYFPNPLLTSTLKEEWGTEQMGSTVFLKARVLAQNLLSSNAQDR